MKRTPSKTADEVIVADPDAAMQRTRDATRHILTTAKEHAATTQTKPRKRRK
jgi:hypothetical protein